MKIFNVFFIFALNNANLLPKSRIKRDFFSWVFNIVEDESEVCPHVKRDFDLLGKHSAYFSVNKKIIYICTIYKL